MLLLNEVFNNETFSYPLNLFSVLSSCNGAKTLELP